MRIQDSPGETVEQLYKALSGELRRFIARRVSDPELAEDLLHDVFLKVHSKVDLLRNQQKIEQWIYQVTRNTIADHYREKRIPRQQVDPDEIADKPAEESQHRRLSRSVRRMVMQLPPSYRDALVMTEFDGISQKELARRLGISISGAKSRVQRARAMLKDLLLQCCHFEFDIYGEIIDYHPISCSCCSQPSGSH